MILKELNNRGWRTLTGLNNLSRMNGTVRSTLTMSLTSGVCRNCGCLLTYPGMTCNLRCYFPEKSTSYRRRMGCCLSGIPGFPLYLMSAD